MQDTTHHHIGLIGTGVIGSAVITNLAKQGRQIWVSKRNAETSTRLAKNFDHVRVGENQDVIDHSDILFIALPGGIAKQALNGLRFRSDQVIFSMMADIDLATLSAWISPAKAAAIVIPFPQIAQGGSPILSLGDQTLLEELFGATETIISLDTSQELQVFLSAQAVLSPAAVLIAQAATWAGEKTGQRNKAEAFLRSLIASSLSGLSSDDLITALNTPGGYNQRLRQHFEDAGFHDLIKIGLNALYHPLKEDE
jgi:pyrroline-5-carboxylate reductase